MDKYAEEKVHENSDSLCDEAFSANFPDELLSTTKAKAFLGGTFDPKNANFVERTIIKAVVKTSESVDTVSEKKITQFAQALKS